LGIRATSPPFGPIGRHVIFLLSRTPDLSQSPDAPQRKTIGWKCPFPRRGLPRVVGGCLRAFARLKVCGKETLA
jgi:hypothetical protein